MTRRQHAVPSGGLIFYKNYKKFAEKDLIKL